MKLGVPFSIMVGQPAWPMSTMAAHARGPDKIATPIPRPRMSGMTPQSIPSDQTAAHSALDPGP
jgi:hypothetical protein